MSRRMTTMKRQKENNNKKVVSEYNFVNNLTFCEIYPRHCEKGCNGKECKLLGKQK